MKKTFLFLGLALLIGVLCSCGGNANTNSGEQSPDSEMYDSGDGPSEEEYEYAQASKGNNFKAVAYSEKDNIGFLLYTTEDRTAYYQFDNEVDYANLLLAAYVWYNAYIALDDETVGKYGHLIWSIPYAEQLKNDPMLKNAFLKTYYNCKDKRYSVIRREFGYQSFKFCGLDIAFVELTDEYKSLIAKNPNAGARAVQRLNEWGIPNGSVLVQFQHYNKFWH